MPPIVPKVRNCYSSELFLYICWTGGTFVKMVVPCLKSVIRGGIP